MTRRVLPQRRASETFALRFWNQSFTVSVGLYPDGTPGEVFIDGGKTGQDIQSTARDAAVLSLALQHGTAIETIRHAVSAAAPDQRLRSSVRSSMRFQNCLKQRKAPAMGEHQVSIEFLTTASLSGPWVLTTIEPDGMIETTTARCRSDIPGRDDAHPLCGAIRSDVSQSKP